MPAREESGITKSIENPARKTLKARKNSLHWPMSYISPWCEEANQGDKCARCIKIVRKNVNKYKVIFLAELIIDKIDKQNYNTGILNAYVCDTRVQNDFCVLVFPYATDEDQLFFCFMHTYA